MYIQEIAEVVLGLIFIWIILSTTTMQLHEWIASIFSLRAIGLQRAIEHMLHNNNLADIFYDHPLINSLSYLGDGKLKRKPSYFPPNKFAAALINIIINSGTESSLFLLGLYALRREVGVIKSQDKRREAFKQMSNLIEIARLSTNTESDKPFGNLILVTLEKEINNLGISYPELRPIAQNMLEKVHYDKNQIDKLLKDTKLQKEDQPRLEAIIKGILAFSVTNPNLKLTLNSILLKLDGLSNEGEDALQTIQQEIESWFNDTMDRLSGWYKQKAQTVTFLIGFTLAIVLNIDSIQITNHLWREPVLRQVIIAYIDQNIARSNTVNDLNIMNLLSISQDEIMNITVPVGWSFVELPSDMGCQFVPTPGTIFGILWNDKCFQPAETKDSTNGWFWVITKLTGLLITGFASSQGSSFWFDILIKIVNIRISGKKPDIA